MKRRLYFYVSILLLAAGLLIWQAGTRAPRELHHDGRPLSAWLNEVGEGPEEQRARAVAALLAMDPDIWDQLVNMLAARDSVLRRVIARVGGDGILGRLGGSSAEAQHGTALIAFYALGSSARPAVPGLIALLEKPHARNLAVPALAGIGADAVPALIQSLTNGNPEVRSGAAECLGSLHEKAIPALPSLRNLSHDSSTNVSAAALRAIHEIETLDR